MPEPVSELTVQPVAVLPVKSKSEVDKESVLERVLIAVEEASSTQKAKQTVAVTQVRRVDDDTLQVFIPLKMCKANQEAIALALGEFDEEVADLVVTSVNGVEV